MDAAASRPPARRAPRWLVVAISAIAGLFYAYAVWNAVGNLVLTIADLGAVGMSLNALGWFVWIFAGIFPLLVWAAAFALGFRRPAHELLLLMLTGLGLVAVFWLNVIAYTVGYSTSLVG